MLTNQGKGIEQRSSTGGLRTNSSLQPDLFKIRKRRTANIATPLASWVFEGESLFAGWGFR